MFTGATGNKYGSEEFRVIETMAITAPSGELFFTKTNNQKKTKQTKKGLSRPHIHVQIENNTYKCLDATAGRSGGGAGGGGAGFSSTPTTCFLRCVSPPSLPTSRVGHGMEAGPRWDR